MLCCFSEGLLSVRNVVVCSGVSLLSVVTLVVILLQNLYLLHPVLCARICRCTNAFVVLIAAVTTVLLCYGTVAVAYLLLLLLLLMVAVVMTMMMVCFCVVKV